MPLFSIWKTYQPSPNPLLTPSPFPSFMRQRLSRLKSDDLIRDSFLMFAAGMVFNVFSYGYHFYVGRALGPADYAVVGSLLSLVAILGVPMGTVQAVITNFVSRYNAKGEQSKVSFLFSFSTKRLFLLGLVCSLALALSAPIVASFLKIESTGPILALSVVFFFSFLSPVTNGILNGMQNFRAASFLTALGGLFKFFFGFLFVYLGFRVSGAIFAFALSGLIPLLLSFYLLRNLPTEKTPVPLSGLFSYSRPVFLSLVCLAIFSNIDVILVKHFFPATEAGYYAAAALFGRLVFFVAGPIASVMFPKVSDLMEKGLDYFSTLKKALALVFLISSGASLAFLLVPTWFILPLFGSAYLPAASLLFLFGLSMLFYALSNMLVMFCLSVQRYFFLPNLLFFSALEILLIYLFHSSLIQVLQVMLFSFFLLFLSLLPGLYRFRNAKPVSQIPPQQSF